MTFFMIHDFFKEFFLVKLDDLKSACIYFSIAIIIKLVSYYFEQKKTKSN